MPTIRQLILASQSPFRKALLDSTGLVYSQEVAPIDERVIQHTDPKQLAIGRAKAKALAVAQLRPASLVIGSDQVLGFEGRTFDKETTAEGARRRLTELSGKTHFLYSAVALAFLPESSEGKPDGASILREWVVEVPIPMRPLTREEIDSYVDTGEWQGSVGCYQFENRGIHLIHLEGVQADHSSIIGLPLASLLGHLRELGINGLTQPRPPWQRK